MKVYRYLTGGEGAEFCHKVTKALNLGFELYGAPTHAVGPDGQLVCGQAVIKEVAGDYSPELKLGEL
jgi:hypothetical protein